MRLMGGPTIAEWSSLYSIIIERENKLPMGIQRRSRFLWNQKKKRETTSGKAHFQEITLITSQKTTPFQFLRYTPKP